MELFNLTTQEAQLKTGAWVENVQMPYDKINLFTYCWSFELTSIKFCDKSHKTRVKSQEYTTVGRMSVQKWVFGGIC